MNDFITAESLNVKVGVVAKLTKILFVFIWGASCSWSEPFCAGVGVGVGVELLGLHTEGCPLHV